MPLELETGPEKKGEVLSGPGPPSPSPFSRSDLGSRRRLAKNKGEVLSGPGRCAGGRTVGPRRDRLRCSLSVPKCLMLYLIAHGQ
jgi:hypothetical protein